MPSIKGRDARNPSPSFGVQELYDDNWRPQEDTDSEELSYGSSPGTSRRSSPQQILSNNLEYGRGIGGQWNGRLQNAPAIPHDTDDGPRISSSPDAGEFPRRHFDTQSEVSGAMPSLHGAPASGVTAGASSSAKHDCNLSSTRVLSGTLQGPSPSAEGVGRPANSKRKQDPRLSQLRKREIELSTKRCKCDDLHPFFAVSGLKYPNIELFPEEDMEMFLANAEKVVDCAAHDPDLVDQCLLIITEDQYHQHQEKSSFSVASVDQCPVPKDDTRFAEDDHSTELRSASASSLATSSRTETAQRSADDVSLENLPGESEERWRCQSSIPRSVFYGRRQRLKPPPEPYSQPRIGNASDRYAERSQPTKNHTQNGTPPEHSPPKSTKDKHVQTYDRQANETERLKSAQMHGQEATPPPSSPMTKNRKRFESDSNGEEKNASASKSKKVSVPELTRRPLLTPTSSPLPRKRKSSSLLAIYSYKA